MERINKIKKTLSTIQDLSQRSKLLCDFKADEKDIKNEFLKVGYEVLNKPYSITKDNRFVISDLLEYFTGNGRIDLNKGIYLHGNLGTGKTVIMQIIRKVIVNLFPFNPNGFLSTSIEQIVEHYKKNNNLTKYGYNNDDIPLNLCINEFGKVINEKIYGTDVNAILESLFMIRYELFQNGKLTHVTSNYSPDELDYPSVIKDRMVEMFNFIELKGESFRS